MTYAAGTIRRRGSRWQVDGWIGPRRVRRSAATQQEARQLLAEIRLERARLGAGRAPRAVLAPTYAQALDGLEIALAGRGLRAATLSSYRQEIAWLRPWWAPRRIADTTPGLIGLYVAECRRKALSTSQIRHRLDRLAQAHRYAVDEGWLPAEPCRVRRPGRTEAEESRRRQPASEHQVEQLLAAADPRERLAVLLARDAGLRRAEIARGRWRDVDADWIRIPVAKGHRPRAVPVLTDRLRAALRESRGMPDTPLVSGRTSGPGVGELFAVLAARAEVRCTLHQLRHAYATWLRDCGHAEAHRMAWLGHVDAQTTDGYTHGSPAPDPALVERHRSPTGHRSRKGRA